ncbi:MAG TPA: hypothetical protein VEH84_00700 [Alphaproteobacteria bacterium]|nr:hypothetical protein [Alphaproteobacteria bacterium]
MAHIERDILSQVRDQTLTLTLAPQAVGAIAAQRAALRGRRIATLIVLLVALAVGGTLTFGPPLPMPTWLGGPALLGAFVALVACPIHLLTQWRDAVRLDRETAALASLHRRYRRDLPPPR